MRQDFFIQEITEPLISPSGDGETIERTARFLQPTAKTSEEAAPVPLGFFYSKQISESQVECRRKVVFSGTRRPQPKWKNWVDQLQPKYSDIWKKSGVFDAILASKCHIREDPETIHGLVEFWCSDTNTFVFEWGEATLTLEDMMILGGFSVLGESVNSFLTKEQREIELEMIEQHKGFSNQKVRRASQSAWINHYMSSENKFEHIAFITLWLTRFVFPAPPSDKVGLHVFPVAIRLAEGIRIALAPAVLASLYRDLNLLKNETSDGVPGHFDIWAPFQLLQTWVWERFLPLRPTDRPNMLFIGDPRVARWNKLNSKQKLQSVVKELNSPDGFQYRPYSTALEGWGHPAYYKDKGGWIDGVEDEDLHSFARCIRPSKLVGLNLVKKYPYFPHRVGMQFGFDQDIPAHASQSSLKDTCDLEKESRLYVPARLFESDVSLRYHQWWKKIISGHRKLIEAIQKQLRTSVNVDEMVGHDTDVDGSVPPGFTPMSKKQKLQEAFDEEDHLTLFEWFELKKRRTEPSCCRHAEVEKRMQEMDEKKASMASLGELKMRTRK